MSGNEPFWLQQCPARGAGLTHAHSKYCQKGVPHDMSSGDPSRVLGELHDEDECCHCRMMPGQAATVAEVHDHDYDPACPEYEVNGHLVGKCLMPDVMLPPDEQVGPALNVQQRLAQMGLIPTMGHQYDTANEPKMADPEKPVYPGPDWGPGRGIMGFRLRQNLNLIAALERTRGYR